MTVEFGLGIVQDFPCTDAVMSLAEIIGNKAGSPRMFEDGEGRREVLACQNERWPSYEKTQ